MRHLTLVHSAPVAAPALAASAGAALTAIAGGDEAAEQSFTSADLIALACWTHGSPHHGYRRVLIEAAAGEGRPDESAYALIYAPGQDWASFGVARSDDGVTVWHCGSGSDLGQYPTMQHALDSLPPVRMPAPLMTRKPAAAARPKTRRSPVRLAWSQQERSA